MKNTVHKKTLYISNYHYGYIPQWWLNSLLELEAPVKKKAFAVKVLFPL